MNAPETDRASPTTGHESLFVALGSVAYLGIVIWRYPLREAVASTLGSGAPRSVLGMFIVNLLLPLLPVLLLLILAWRHRRADGLVAALAPTRRATGVAVCLLIGGAVSWGLDRLQYRPFPWRWPGERVPSVAAALLREHRWVVLLVWFTVGAVIIPVVEEVVFRYWIQRGVRRLTRSAAAAVGISALLFGIAHLGYPPLPPTFPHFVNSVYATLVGLCLGIVALRRGGLRKTMAVHAGMNSLTFVALLYTITTHGTITTPYIVKLMQEL